MKGFKDFKSSASSSFPSVKGYASGGKWISGAIKHPGALHKALGVPQGEKIPAKKLAKAAHSSNPTMRKRAALAKTLGKMHKADGGKVETGTMPPQGPAQNAPHGRVNFNDYKKGGKVHSDEAQDKKLIASELKKRGLKRGGMAKC